MDHPAVPLVSGGPFSANDGDTGSLTAQDEVFLRQEQIQNLSVCSTTQRASPQSGSGDGTPRDLERQTSSRIRSGLLSRAASEADGRRRASGRTPPHSQSATSSIYASASASESDGGGNSSGWSLPSSRHGSNAGFRTSVTVQTSPPGVSSPTAMGFGTLSLADRFVQQQYQHQQQPGSLQSSTLRSPFSEDSEPPSAESLQYAPSLTGSLSAPYSQPSGNISIHHNDSGNLSEGSSSLGRAKSVSSVSSVTSTSSLEAVPFRQAPLGNVRAGYSRGHAGAGWDGLGSAGLPLAPMSAPLAGSDGEVYNNFSSASEMVQMPGTDACGPISKILPPSAAAVGGSLTASNARPRLLPKATQHDWLYRNAPGLAVPGKPGRIASTSSLRSKLVRGAERLGIKPLTTLPLRDAGPAAAYAGLLDAAASSQDFPQGNGLPTMPVSESPISPPLITSSVTNAPLLVPKLPLLDLQSIHAVSLSVDSLSGPGQTSGRSDESANAVEDSHAFIPRRPVLINSASVDHIMTLQEATWRVTTAVEIMKDAGIPVVDDDAADLEVDNLLRTPTRFTHSFVLPPRETPASSSLGTIISTAAVTATGDFASGPLLRKRTPAEQVKFEAQTGIAKLEDPVEEISAMQPERVAVASAPEDSVTMFTANGAAFPPSSTNAQQSISSSSLTTIVADHMAAVTAESDQMAVGAPFGHSHLRQMSSSPVQHLTMAPAQRDRASSSASSSKRPPFLRAATVESVRSIRSAGSRNSAALERDTLPRLAKQEDIGGRSPRLSDAGSIGVIPLAMSREASTGGLSTAFSQSPSHQLMPPVGSVGAAITTSPAGTTLSNYSPFVRPISVVSGISAVSDKALSNATSGENSTTAPAPTHPASSSGRSTRGPQDFDFGEVLGEGSYSTVIQAWDLLSNRRKGQENDHERLTSSSAAQAIAGVQRSERSSSREGKKVYAIKVLDKVHILKQKKQKYVGVEKEALSLLIKLPGVVTLFWTFQDRDSLYFVLELAENGELLSFIKKLGSLDETCARYYGAQLLDTIDGIHKAGILHRDIKPENILLDSKMRIRITDFGSAKILSKGADGEPLEDERASSFVGTAEYVSPELLTDKAATRSSDWWAFGCVLYQMLAGRPPFKGVNEYQTFQKILKRDFEFPDTFPTLAKELIEKLLVLDPVQRLGASPGDLQTMRDHAFFEQEDFTQIWTKQAPELKVGLYVRPPAPEPATFDFSEDESDGLAPDFQQASLTSPKENSLHSTAEDADASDDSGDPPSGSPSHSSEKASRSAEMLPRGAGTKQPDLPHKRSTLSMQSSSSSADMPPEGPSDEQVNMPGRLLHRLSQGIPPMPRQCSNWSALLLPRESLLLSAPVIQRKAGAGQIFSKRRQLVLTSFPRLLCVKESAAALKVKSEIILCPPTSNAEGPGITVPQADSQRKHSATQNTVTLVEAKGQRAFAIHTPLRTYIYEDPSGDNSHWLRSIRGAMTLWTA
ncbi:hypothetical protein K437DRAFT_237393 [Tilletiaria anomala UBC 951]|uniref:non-specific serine/threonine protein kinase n=1 Tax=Tilletiaria anomala (strain ATCC 24038 / CBS 436.72 / UBC 951) TaxID=1037660 RepID=A0A066VMW5_TILAU|nr:uncharacterized protein K437DRAFT_237393 [Tilletiaria anomala UBC 951]KDN43097.1 hypothetical protein K437DRAFT_237393 [Tilletiaria anomala UBC 951]